MANTVCEGLDPGAKIQLNHFGKLVFLSLLFYELIPNHGVLALLDQHQNRWTRNCIEGF